MLTIEISDETAEKILTWWEMTDGGLDLEDINRLAQSIVGQLYSDVTIGRISLGVHKNKEAFVYDESLNGPTRDKLSGAE
jgi:hypothetical protein